MHDLRAPLIGLVLLLLVASIALVVPLYILPQTSTPPAVTPLREIVVPPPPRTQANTTAALKQTMFNLLVSYVDTGFEPQNVAIKAGETIRFTNNSSSDLKLCGTAFTSCKDLKPGEYWEFNFATVGTWTFENKSNPNVAGTVVVQ